MPFLTSSFFRGHLRSKMGISCVPGSFAVQFGDRLRFWDHLRSWDHFNLVPRVSVHGVPGNEVGIICGPAKFCLLIFCQRVSKLWGGTSPHYWILILWSHRASDITWYWQALSQMSQWHSFNPITWKTWSIYWTITFVNSLKIGVSKFPAGVLCSGSATPLISLRRSNLSQKTIYSQG